MKKNLLTKIYLFVATGILFVGCQDIEEPALGDYPKDVANIPAGDLRFFVPFDNDGEQTRYKFSDELSGYPCFTPDNSITQGEGINLGCFQSGNTDTFLKYLNANDFASVAESFTVAFWAKHGAPTQTEFLFTLTADDHWAKASMFLLLEGSVDSPTMKLMVDDRNGDKWFEWVNASSVPGVFDNQWHQFSFVYDATTSTMTCYKDGVAYLPSSQWDNHGAVQFKTEKINGFRIGGSGNPDEGWMNSYTGSIDQFRLYAAAISPSEVQSLYTNRE